MTLLTFLGLLIDTINQMVSIPAQKVTKVKELISSVLQHKKIMVKQLQKICRFLNFVSRCVVPGRVFTRKLYMKLQGTENMKPHHHLKISKNMRDDLQMRLEFINHPSIYCRGFMDFDRTWNAEEISMYSDASKNPVLGFGSISKNSWMYQQ